jgi:D-alanyl-lipoteichoic acid acyltransferase DltB (MBOAT superfamily)
MAWKARFVVLILGLITIDYFAALWIVHKEGRKRRIALLVSLTANIGLLGYFKYTNFLRDIAGLHPLDIILPLGISFHTFQSISYVIDVYRGEQPAITSYVDYALFVAFFPQLVAGPIVRAKEFFLDYFNWQPPTAEEWQRGFAMILTGFVKKLICADQFALVADRYFNDPRALHGFLPAWTGAIAFALQIFFDFSGYTDIAIGVALLFGFHFPENFRRPYLSASITEFWRRWHMTLSGWLRDYVYISLGGNRKGRIRTYANLLATMLIGGLWHGASWNFVIWGGYQGVALSIERIVYGREERKGMIRIPLAVLTFAVTCVGWVFFRAKTLNTALFVIGQMFHSRDIGEFLMTSVQVHLAIATLLIALAEEYNGVLTKLSQGPAWARTAAAVSALLALELFTASDQSIPFVYFQF